MAKLTVDKIGKFEITETIGEGGMGVVYKARDPLIERDVAIKVILERALNIPEIKERFYREARSAGNLSHENITVVYEVGEVDGNPYIVMEYLEGAELKKVITEKKGIPLQEKINYAIQICKGLQYAHSKKIVHRDIKPDNMMVSKDGKIKIMDFGIAKPEASNLTQTGMTVGTLAYMSPEQIKGTTVDNRSDIFSFGVLFYELLTYKKPFEGVSPTVMYKIIHEEPDRIELEEHEQVDILQDIVSKCLQKKPEDRYSDCSEIIRDLEEILSLKDIERTIEDLLDQGRTLCMQNDSEAIEKFDQILNIDPEHEEALRLKQECLSNMHDGKTATIVLPIEVARPPQLKQNKNKGIYVVVVGALLIIALVFLFRGPIQTFMGGNTPPPEIVRETPSPPRDLSALKLELASARSEAEKKQAPVQAAQIFKSALDFEQKALESEKAEQFTEAENFFKSARDKFREASAVVISAEIASLADAATSVRKKAVFAREQAQKRGAKDANSFKKGMELLASADNKFNRQIYQNARSEYFAAEDFFKKAIKEVADLKRTSSKRSQLISQAKGAEDEVIQARSEADAVNAKSLANEAYRYAEGRANEGNQLVTKKDYSSAIKAFQDATLGYGTAVNEKNAADKAQKLFQQGDYTQSLQELDAVFVNTPYNGENKKARKLYTDIQRAQFNLEQKIEDAKSASNRGDLMSALAFLNALPDRDNEIFEVRDLRKTIIAQDQTPPVIQHTANKEYDPQEPIEISATVQDNLAINQVTLFYVKKGIKTYAQGRMQTQGKGTYDFMILQEYHKGKEIRYYFVAVDANNNKKNLATQKKPYKIKSKSKTAKIPQVP